MLHYCNILFLTMILDAVTKVLVPLLAQLQMKEPLLLVLIVDK